MLFYSINGPFWSYYYWYGWNKMEFKNLIWKKHKTSSEIRINPCGGNKYGFCLRRTILNSNGEYECSTQKKNIIKNIILHSGIVREKSKLYIYF